jgi:predicted transglutaminase-like cysteine proteinase
MIRVQAILQSTRTAHETEVSLRLVNHWVERLRAIPYGFSTQWKTPVEVESGATADCKGKAVALYEKMRSAGAKNLRLVIGRRTPSSRSTHAWLEWSTPDGIYVLDPTINWAAYRIDEVGKDRYVPFYAYSGSHKFGAATATLLAKN